MLKRYGNQRDANEPEIVRALEQAGCSVIRLNTPADLLVGRTTPQGKRTYLIEVKSANGTLTRDQDTFTDLWRGQFSVVRSVEDALIAVGVAI